MEHIFIAKTEEKVIEDGTVADTDVTTNVPIEEAMKKILENVVKNTGTTEDEVDGGFTNFVPAYNLSGDSKKYYAPY